MYTGRNHREDFELQPNFNYCNIHGDPLEVFESIDTCELVIKLRDLKKTGFQVFKIDEFDSARVHPK